MSAAPSLALVAHFPRHPTAAVWSWHPERSVNSSACLVVLKHWKPIGQSRQPAPVDFVSVQRAETTTRQFGNVRQPASPVMKQSKEQPCQPRVPANAASDSPRISLRPGWRRASHPHSNPRSQCIVSAAQHLPIPEHHHEGRSVGRQEASAASSHNGDRLPCPLAIACLGSIVDYTVSLGCLVCSRKRPHRNEPAAALANPIVFLTDVGRQPRPNPERRVARLSLMSQVLHQPGGRGSRDARSGT